MPQVNCKVCKKEFYVKPYHQRIGMGIYCSTTCQYIGARKGKYILCDVCGKKTWKEPRQLKRSKSGKLFCSKSCHMVWKNKIMNLGENHPNWVNGKYAERGVLERSGRKIVCELCKTKDKRIMAVHHKDRNNRNNKLLNLAWLCHNCHFLVHNYNVKFK